MGEYASLSQYLAGINSLVGKDGCIYPGQSLQIRRGARPVSVRVHDDILDAAMGVFDCINIADVRGSYDGYARGNNLENVAKLKNPKPTGHIKIPLRPTMWLTARTRVILKVRKGTDSSSSSSSA
jgi:hypothetical protein